MRVFGLLVVRNGVDMVRLCVLHHLGLGLERILVVDNGSSDGTPTVLDRLARKLPLTWTSDPGPYRQHEMFTRLAHEATRAGADWLMPLDHDELWVSERPLPEALAVPAGAVSVPVVNFVQRRAQARPSPRAPLTMTLRAARTVEPIRAQELVERGQLSFLEYEYPRKLIFRASERLQIQRGAHWARELDGPVVRGEGVTVLHAPLPSRAALDRKVLQGRRIVEAGFVEREGWHTRRWAGMAANGQLAREWRALSYEDGHLDVYGTPHPLVADPRLRDAAAPWVRSPLAQLAARVLRRSY